MSWLEEMKDLLFSGQDNDLGIIESSMAALTVGFAFNFRDAWREALQTWPEDKPLPWGPQDDGEGADIPSDLPLESWGRELAISPREAFAAMADFIARRTDRRPPIIVIDPKYKLKTLLYLPSDDYTIHLYAFLSVSSSVYFIEEAPSTGEPRRLYQIFNMRSQDDAPRLIREEQNKEYTIENILALHTDVLKAIDMEIAPASSPPPRFLRSQVKSRAPDQARQVVGYFRPDVEHLVSVWIAPLAPGETADGPAFPEEKLQPGPLGSELTVVLIEPDRLAEPLVQALLLPREGRSDECVFALPPLKPGVFNGMLAVLHRNRVVQTAALSGSVAPAGSPEERPIAFKIDAVIRQDLADLEFRDAFDAAILIGGDRSRTVIAGDQAYIREMEDVTAPAAVIRETLDAATRQEEPSLDDLLYTCAHQGILLRSAILDGAPASLAQARAIQLVSAKPEAYLPLEFCYDGDAPDETATACPDIAEGCRTGCPKAGTAAVVCPMSFWGLSRVIERHVFDSRDTVESGWELRAETCSGTRAFGPLRAAVVGASDRADNHPGSVKVTDVIASLEAIGLAPANVRNWSDWRERVGGLTREHASLLLVIGHTEQDPRARVEVLEIGGDRLQLSKLGSAGRDYVGQGNALALLLGCDTVGGGPEVNRFASGFRRNGAAVVIGTTTAILGLHAAPLAKALVEELAGQTVGDTPVSLGELMRRLRVRFLAKDVPIGLAAVAFGDADWRFGGAAP